jgi:ATP-dependent helicase HrpA
VLPLFGRLHSKDQRKIFRHARQRKIIVATNIAETSITVPGIRYIIDTGLARISRYNPRSRTTSLQVAQISRAGCDQRAGRCGRTGPGRCIRLYSEENYHTRPEYTQPEIQRSNLAEVILQMISLRLGDPRSFPFIDPPTVSAVRDGYKVLLELGAITPDNDLTHRGKIMARLPLDPSISRIIIEAAESGALKEVKVIAAGLSIQDPRIRPAEKEARADEMHRRFQDTISDFMGLLKIWDTFHATAGQVRSQAKLRKFCATHYLSWQRMREWQDIHEQITDLIRQDKKFRDNEKPATYEAVHQALLSGFLRNIGRKKGKNLYTVRGGKEAMIFPGSTLFNRAGQWMVCASFMETGRLYAMNVATIDDSWLERIGGNLCRHSWSDPHWEKKTGRVTALEKVTLFGLVIVAGRRVNYGRISDATAREAREIFIHQALVRGELGGRYGFLCRNMALLKKYRGMEDRTRRKGIVFDDMSLYAFYNARLGNVYDRFTLNRAIKKQKNDDFLRMRESDICRDKPDADELYRFPTTLETMSLSLPLSYRFEPGHEADGITVDIPLSHLHTLSPALFEWLVPGLLQEKILALLKYLSKKLRRRLVPLPETTEKIMDSLDLYRGSLYAAMEKTILKLLQVRIHRTDWQPDKLPLHLKMRFRLRDSKNSIVRTTRSFDDLSNWSADSRLPKKNQPTKIILPDIKRLTNWDCDQPPQPLGTENHASMGREMYYPALIISETGQWAELHYIKEREKSFALNRSGLRYLYGLQFKAEIKALARECKAAVAGHTASWLSLGLSLPAGEVRKLLLNFVLDDIFAIRDGILPDRETFVRVTAHTREKGLVREGRSRIRYILELLGLRRTLHALLDKDRGKKGEAGRKETEFRDHLDTLLPRTFLSDMNLSDLAETGRYLKALAIRLERAHHSPAKDNRKAVPVQSAADRLKSIPENHSSAECMQILTEYAMMVEEFRVSVFAPELGTTIPVSEKRLLKKWQEVENICLRVE